MVGLAPKRFISSAERQERRLLAATIRRFSTVATHRQPSLNRAWQYVDRGLAKLLPDSKTAENLRGRMALLAGARTDEAVQQRELGRCQAGVEGFIYWLAWYAWTYDPRGNPRTLPFVPFEYQEEAARWIVHVRENGLEGIVEKARDMGATWLFVAYFTWCWLFETEFTGLFCSRKVTLVDSKGDPSSIMHKARMLIRGLPLWMLPEGYDESKHALKLRILNPANGSVMIGEGGNQIGRGGRASIVLVDEAAFIPQPGTVEAALSETAEVKFWLSTPNIPNDWFCLKRFSGNYPVLSLRWKRDPRKNAWIALDGEGNMVTSGHGESPDPSSIGARRIIYPWYEKAKQRFTDKAKMAREVDIDYTASSDRVVFQALWVAASINLDLGDMGEVVECGADLAGEGEDTDQWTMRRGAAVVVQKQIDRPNPTQRARAFLMATETVGGLVLHYDAGGGYGGALSGEYDTATNGGKVWPFQLHALNFGGKCSGRKFGDRPAKELFRDMKTELHYAVRERFRRSYELSLWRQGDPTGVPHDPTDCISIPDDPELVGQLCSILTVELPSGKVGIEPKADMKTRGMKSPDKAESLILSFAHTPLPSATHGAPSVALTG